MTDLISRAVAIRAFTGKPPEYYHTSYIVGELNAIPAVDAVPVVRCKDCPRWDAATQYRSGYCKKLRYCTPPDFYCKYGSEEQS